MKIYDIIHKKRLGHSLTREEIFFAINGYVSGEIADYQMSALCMAICINSMNEDEVFNLTDAMLHSGDTIDLSRFGDLSVDKHSTGGVGDKTTLIVAPIVASLGGKLAKMSGRGLGHTGGTIDKLESFHGFKTSLDVDEFLNQVEKTGVCVIGQSESLVPADKKLYALRDVTATVESIPLIASSIMSKKLASGAKSIVLDIKVGSGAFMKNIEDATLLAEAMVKIGKGFGRSVRAIITNMDTPLGLAVGNSLEVYEAIEVLSGRKAGALYDVCIALSSNMISLAKKISIDEATRLCKGAISDGSALSKLEEWVLAQGGDASQIKSNELLLGAKYKRDVYLDGCGYIEKINALDIGMASMHLGAGRTKKDDIIDTYAGVFLKHTVGDCICSGEPIATLYSSSENGFDEAERTVKGAITLSSTEPKKENTIIKII